jgi:probable phosphoglycerate mutase
MKKEIYIIRHGQTDFNAKHIIQGSGIDSDLNHIGRSQREAFFQKYQHVPFEAVLTSNLKRTHQTVLPFIEKGLNWERHSTINEMNWGVHEGKKGTPAMREEYIRMVGEWKKGNYNFRITGGESAKELADRLQIFVNHLKVRKEEKILVCSHGRAMRCMMAVLKEEALYEMEQYNHSNTGLYKVIFDGKFHFDLIDDTSHLELTQI